MALFDFLKKKKKEEEVKEKKKVAARKPREKKVPLEKKPLEVLEKEEIKKEVKAAPKKEKKEVLGIAYKLLKTPHITEKATDLVAKNQYVFKVFPRANKTELKKAIKDVYGADAVSVKIINIPRKKMRLGRVEGFKKGYKKAIVKLKEGQKIEVLPR